MNQHEKRREPTIHEIEALTWLVAWRGPKLEIGRFRKASGVAAYRDVYDYHTSSDVREIIHVTGSKRAVYDLMHFMADDAREHGLRVMGQVDFQNIAMNLAIEKLGGLQVRTVWEDARA